MTTYQSGAAFRRALEDRLASQSAKTSMPLIRLRKLVVFDRFLARLVELGSDTWLLKGGLVLQLRLSQHARTTKDMDLLALIAENMMINGPALRTAIQATFMAQRAGESPSSLPTPPSSWALTFRKLAEEVGLNCTTLEECDRAARSFLDPILGGATQGVWVPERRVWI